ncbi:hypothetical protein IG631_07784 [Alternaria alternata]|nr:hypothetical protein IG631_07784 [Alternaria alternata]
MEFVHNGTERVAPIMMASVSHPSGVYDLEDDTLSIASDGRSDVPVSLMIGGDNAMPAASARVSAVEGRPA